MNREQAWAELRQLYARLPEVQCKGLCYDSCTSTDASELEREAIVARGVDLPPGIRHEQLELMIANGHTPRCPALSPVNTCTIYDVRPFLCRVFGAIRTQACEHKCMADGWLEEHEVTRVMVEIEMLSREVTGVAWSGGKRTEIPFR